jgi:23S rRNA (guanosine2251-2'-O)-methyltransferase
MPLTLVIGSEGKGMSRLIREKCDFLVQLPMVGHVTSLNASVAASLLMYEVYRKRHPLGE